MMASYKLTYVDSRSRGEVIRLLFHAAGVDFEDIRISVPDEYKKLPLEKRKYLPLLEVNGKKMSQSYAVARYLAREFGLAGKTSWEAGLIDEYLGHTEELMYYMSNAYSEKNEEKKKELYKNMIEVRQPLFMKIFDEAIQTNGGNYLVGDSLTLADLTVYNIFDTRVMNDPHALDSYPRLKENRKATESHPRIAAYLKTRKHTDI